jgi:uncharacterized membrane-anchored protein YitT (DUF2179 family)
MNPLFTQIIIQTTMRRRKNRPTDRRPSRYELAKGYREFWIQARRLGKDAVLITIGIFSAAFGLKGFLLPNQFIDGGATGISLLLTAITALPLPMFIVVVNLPFIVMGHRLMGWLFAAKTALAIAGLALCLATVSFPLITSDKLLVAVFGGFFLGAGIGFAVRGGCVIDGTEVLAIFLSRKLGTTIGDIIMGINVLIFLAVAYFLGIEIALYSMVTYLAASKAVDFFVEGIEEYIGVTIVANHVREIKQMIVQQLGRGVTVYSGKSGYGKQGESRETDIIFTVITRLEVNKLNTELQKIEPSAFVVMTPVKDTKGGMIKQRPLKH